MLMKLCIRLKKVAATKLWHYRLPPHFYNRHTPN
jgi:hypothetical protein